MRKIKSIQMNTFKNVVEIFYVIRYLVYLFINKCIIFYSVLNFT